MIVPLPRAVALASVAMIPAALAVLSPQLAWGCVAIDAAIVLLAVIDFVRAPRADWLSVTRAVEPVISAGIPNRVQLQLALTAAAKGEIEGELRDQVPPGPIALGHRAAFRISAGGTTVTWRLTPQVRGDLRLGPLHLRLYGPWRLCARQLELPLVSPVKVYPDLTALSRDALKLTRARDDEARRIIRRPAEGREFESLREYQAGDDRRTVDWKATARRGKPMVRVTQPERNQQVLLLLDCGRHMAGETRAAPDAPARRKLDFAVDAALRVAKVSLDQGDLVGMLAFGSGVKAWLPPRKGAEALKAICALLYRVEATLEESDYGAAIELAFSRGRKRSLVLLFTDLLDADTSAALVKRTLKLVPRHLPVVACLRDEELRRVAQAVPVDAPGAFERQVAVKLEDEYRLTAARLRDAGARVIRASAQGFGAATVNAYLEIKQRGLL
ncbi:MAG: Cell division protein DivIC [Myxococcaceae bacterium]|nr:Cell division protein DivIC [Myxococcaceae bacterium]